MKRPSPSPLKRGDRSTYNSLDRTFPNTTGRGASIGKEDLNYWYSYLPDSKILYLQFRQIRNSEEGPGFSDFVKQVEEEIESREISKIVIDNRYGGGGNGFKLKPLTDLIRQSESLNQWGRLFVLTRRGTRRNRE